MSDLASRILEAANASSVMLYRWKNRGRAPAGYIRGMAITFADAHAALKQGDAIVAKITAPSSGDPDHDVLDWYSDRLAAAGIEGGSAEDRLIQIFTILVGLGMRESSGKHCEGRDMSAENVTADTAEAGLFQVSYNSIGKRETLKSLFQRYKGRTDHLEVFDDGVHCSASSWKDWGEGPGREFQELTKECPAFAVAHAAVLLRSARSHWGPIKRKEAEVRPDAAALFRTIAGLVDAG